MSIGKMIRKYRKLSGISQSQLAKRVHITQSFVSKIERGEYKVDADLLYDIASVLNVNIAKLFENRPISTFGEETLSELERLAHSGRFNDMIILVKTAFGSEFFKDPKQMFKLYQWKAVGHVFISEPENALCIVDNLLLHPQYVDDSGQFAGLYAISGISHYHMGNTGKAISDLIKARESLPTTNQRSAITLIRDYIYLYLGLVYSTMGDYNEAKKYLRLAANKIDEQIELDIKQQCQVLRALLNVEINNGHHELAIEYLLEYIRKCEFISDTRNIIRGHAKLGMCYNKIGKLDAAKEHFQIASALSKQYPKEVETNIRSILLDAGYM